MSQSTIPIAIDDSINARILAVSEDQIAGFVRDPIGCIADRCGIPIEMVIERIVAMMRAGTIRRVRQTLMSTSLAPGALVAWQVPNENINSAFDFMSRQDPFSGHVVIRMTDAVTAGSDYRLWTTLKVPVGFSMVRHCDWLGKQTGAVKYKLLPAKKLFTLGVGHVRRRQVAPGERINEPGCILDVSMVELTEQQWRVLMILKREFEPDEIGSNLWAGRATEAGLLLEEFFSVAESLAQRKVIGRFSTFLEHVKKLKNGMKVTKYNALFHWSVPPGRELDAGCEVGRHLIMTHAYWREGGPEFNNVNIMGVAHGTDKEWMLAHKAAIDRHLEEASIPVAYTNVFWGGRSEIKPSEISPIAYAQWCQGVGLDPSSMRG